METPRIVFELAENKALCSVPGKELAVHNFYIFKKKKYLSQKKKRNSFTKLEGSWNYRSHLQQKSDTSSMVGPSKKSCATDSCAGTVQDTFSVAFHNIQLQRR
jgi:hypothetical protein